jgi:hypothetical protein
MPRFLALFLPALALTAPGAFAADRALVVGITEYSSEYIAGPIACDSDAMEMAVFLQQKLDFPTDSVKMLLNRSATYGEILNGFKDWLIGGSAPGDRVFFFFSGHGNQVPDKNGDEADGWDETLCPADTSPFNHDRQITDDTIDTLVRLLQGRRVVLVFDCCHSGTDAGSKNLGESFLDPSGLGGLGGVVIVSASASSQTAWAMLVDGKPHGGLTYSLQEAFRGAEPSVREMQARMAERIARYHASGRLGGAQEVVVQALPETLLDLPLFGTGKPARPAPASARGGRLVLEAAPPGPPARLGDRAAYRVTGDRAGRLYLLSFKPNNTVACLFPNAFDADNSVPAGALTLPRGEGYAFQAVRPAGPELVAAVLSPEPLALCDKAVASWADVLWRLRSKALVDALGKLPGMVLDQALVRTAASGAESPADVAVLRVDTEP